MAATRRARLRARIRVVNLVLMGALLAYAVAVATSGLLGGLVIAHLSSLHSQVAKVLLGLCIWDAGKALGVGLGAVAIGRLGRVGPKVGGIALTVTTYAFDLGVALMLGQAAGAWTRIEALLGRAAVAVLIGWMAVAILRRLGDRGAPSLAPADGSAPAPPGSGAGGKTARRRG